MRVYLCILISEKNIKFLNVLLNSLNNIEIPKNYNLQLVFVMNTKIFFCKNTIKKVLNKINYSILSCKKDNIPASRNIFLKFLKDRNFKYAGFLDDDCVINRNWLLSMTKFIAHQKCDIVGGPQKHQVKNEKIKDYYEILEPNRFHGQKIKWVATNNCFFSEKILKKTNFFFDEKLSAYGGSDQLFFRNFYKKDFIIKWNSFALVTEQYQIGRECKSWFLKRNFRYGYSGNKIDEKIHGKFSSIIILSKMIFLLFCAILYIFFPNKKNYLKSLFFICRFSGRFAGLFHYKPRKYI